MYILDWDASLGEMPMKGDFVARKGQSAVPISIVTGGGNGMVAVTYIPGTWFIGGFAHSSSLPPSPYLYPARNTLCYGVPKSG